MNRQKRPPRPLGLTLALLGSTLVFSIIPLFVIGTLVYLNNRVYSPEEGSYMGFNMPGLNYEPLIIYGITAVFFMAMAILAWKRRHPFIRILFPLITLIYGALTLVAVTSGGTSEGLDSTMEFQAGVTGFYLALIIGTVVYVVWFMNRWSARAYYRGYYTPADKSLLDEAYGKPAPRA